MIKVSPEIVQAIKDEEAIREYFLQKSLQELAEAMRKLEEGFENDADEEPPTGLIKQQ